MLRYERIAVKRLNPVVRLIIIWQGTPKEAALNLISQGADVIFPSMDNAVIGSLQGVREKGAMGIGIYYDAIVDWPDTVIQSAIFDMHSAQVEVISTAKAGNMESKSYVLGLETPNAARFGSYSERVSAGTQASTQVVVDKTMAGGIATR